MEARPSPADAGQPRRRPDRGRRLPSLERRAARPHLLGRGDRVPQGRASGRRGDSVQLAPEPSLHGLEIRRPERSWRRRCAPAGCPRVILNPASIMGPGDHLATTPHNRLYRTRSAESRLFGSFAGGLAVVDVRDLTALILKALDRGRIGEKYLAVGANLTYPDVIRLIAPQLPPEGLSVPGSGLVGRGRGRVARGGTPAHRAAPPPDGGLRAAERLDRLLLQRKEPPRIRPRIHSGRKDRGRRMGILPGQLRPFRITERRGRALEEKYGNAAENKVR